MDFEWFDPQPAVDFHGLKTLLRQLLDSDAQLFDLSALADLILSQPLLGSTVKVDGNESDPYAFLSVLNLHEHRVTASSFSFLSLVNTLADNLQDKPVIADLIDYLKRKAASNPSLSPLAALLAQVPTPPIGLILTERLINMPVEVVPPMYSMLMEEIQWAIEEKEPYNFSHYLVLSKTYEEVESKLDAEDGSSRPQKKKKKLYGGGGGGSSSLDRLYFHPEDSVLERHAVCHGAFEYTHKHADGHSDSKRAFQELGIQTSGSLIVVDASKFETVAKEMADYVRLSG